jgi:hypothetical protein
MHVDHKGTRYYQTKTGHFLSRRKSSEASSQLLHRVLWEEAYGEISVGNHIHHLDGNPANNSLENLASLSASEHMRHHQLQRFSECPELRERTTQNMRSNQHKVQEWRESEVGRVKLREICFNNAKARNNNKPTVCLECGASFLAYSKQAKYCGDVCRKLAFKKLTTTRKDRPECRLITELTEKSCSCQCQQCQQPFKAFSTRTKLCSKECAHKWALSLRRIRNKKMVVAQPTNH